MHTCCIGNCRCAPCAGGCCDRGNSLTCQKKINDSAHCTKERALWHGREKEPLHGEDMCNVLWENLPRVCLMLHKCWVPSIWRDVRITHYLYSSFYSITLKQLFYSAICCQAFLIEIKEEHCTISLLFPPHPSAAHHHNLKPSSSPGVPGT